MRASYCVCIALLVLVACTYAVGESVSESSIPASSSMAPILSSAMSSANSALQESSSSEESSRAAESSESSRPVPRKHKRRSGVQNSQITIVQNNNNLVHYEQGTSKADSRRLEEQSVKQANEENRKRRAERGNARRQEETRKKEREDAARREREAEEKEKKNKEEGEKRTAEEKEKAARKEEEGKKQEEQQKKNEQDEKARKREQDEKAAKQEQEEKARKQKEEADKKEAEANNKKEQRQKLTQVNIASGWSNYQNTYGLATSFKYGDYCFVSGLLAGHYGNDGHMVTLNERCRPHEGRLIFTLHKGDVESRVDVLPDGRVYYIAGGGSSWISLNGIWFTTRIQQGIQLHWGWVPYGYGYRSTGQSNINGLCAATGLIRSGNWGYFAQFQGSCYSQDGRLIFSANNHASISRVDVLHGNGLVLYSGGSANHGWVSLDGIMLTPHGGNYFNPFNGWRAYGGGYRPPSWNKVGDICSMSGLMAGHWSGHIFTLPQGCRPRARIIFGCNVHNHNARIDVLPDGGVHYINRGSGYNWMSLDCIKFRAVQ